MVCKNCGRVDQYVHKFCPYCGYPTQEKPKLSSKSRIFLTSFIVIILLLMMVGMFSTFIAFPVAISKLESIEPAVFESYVEQMGCELMDGLEDNPIDGVNFFQFTDLDTCPFEVGFGTYSNKDVRWAFYQTTYDLVDNNGNVTGYSHISYPSYNEYTTHGDYYKSVIMLDNTILYVIAPSSYAQDAQKVLEELGYSPHLSGDYWSLVYVSIFLMIILFFISWWKINVKFGRKGWSCLIPIYNLLCLGENLFGKKWYGILYLIPIINIIFIIISLYRLGKSFGRDDIGSVLIVVIPLIFIPMLAFDNSKCLKCN